MFSSAIVSPPVLALVLNRSHLVEARSCGIGSDALVRVLDILRAEEYILPHLTSLDISHNPLVGESDLGKPKSYCTLLCTLE